MPATKTETPAPKLGDAPGGDRGVLAPVRGPHGPVGIVSGRDLTMALAEAASPVRERARDADRALRPLTGDLRPGPAHPPGADST